MNKALAKQLTEFRAIYSSGIFIPNGEAVTALCLLFQKVFLPNNIELIKEFSKKFRISIPARDEIENPEVTITSEDGAVADPFSDLTLEQKSNAFRYLGLGMRFSIRYEQLFGEVFETNLFEEGVPLKVKLVKKGAPGKLNKYKVTLQALTVSGGDEDVFPDLVRQGYVPVIGDYHPGRVLDASIDTTTAKQLAALLAMKSIQLLFPATRSASDDAILEARHRLSDHLPPFWSSMFKLSVELKRRIRECKSAMEVIPLCQYK